MLDQILRSQKSTIICRRIVIFRSFFRIQKTATKGIILLGINERLFCFGICMIRQLSQMMLGEIKEWDGGVLL